MQAQKRYVVWEGVKTWIFTDRNEVQPLVSGFKRAKYKAFSSLQEAEQALQSGWDPYYQVEKKWNEKSLPFVKESIAVDAACSSATGIMEYQGIDLVSEQIIFKVSQPIGTNNIWEFLAIVHGISWLQKQGKIDYVLYSDSKIAIDRVKNWKCRTNLAPNDGNIQLFELIKRAEEWLVTNYYRPTILKRNTREWWEIPADFGRK